MKHFVRIVAAASAPLLLTGCFLLPGKFDATLKILAGDRYEFSYAGEIQISLPEDGKTKKPSNEPFDPDKLRCRDLVYKSNGETDPARPVYGDDFDQYADEVTEAADAVGTDSSSRSYDVVARDCTADEIADRKSQYDADQERKQKRYEEEAAMAGALFGGPIPGDEESLKEFAVQLRKYAGWEKVEHAGGNIFNVEFRESGLIGNYFSFPVLPDAQMQYPFFQIMRRNDGAIELLTPSVAGQGGLFNMMMMKEGGGKGAPEISEIDGTLTVETNGTVVSNNSADGFLESGSMKSMQWKIGKNAASEDGPRVLIRF